MTTAWFWQPAGASARGTALVPFSSGMAIPDWTTPVVWPFNIGGRFSSGITLATGTPGLSSLCSDNASGLWALSWAGQIWRLGPNGAVIATPTLPSNAVYNGCAVTGSVAYFMAASGAIFTSGGTQFGTWPSYAKSLVASGSTLVALLPAAGVGTMNANTGATGLINFPVGITTPSCLNFSSGGTLAVGGWQNARPLLPTNAAALDPQNPLTLVGVGSGQAISWSASSLYGEDWAQSQTFSGLANLTSMAWRPDGTQILAASATGGLVQVLNYLFGALSLAQTLVVSNPTSVVVGSDSAHALVAQSGITQLTSLIYSGGAWVASFPIAGASGFTALAPVSGGAVVTYGSGIAYINLGSAGFVLGPIVPLSFAPSVIATDQFNVVYAAGSGVLAAISGSTVLGLGGWAGGYPSAILAHQGRVIVASPNDGRYYVFGQSSPPGSLSGGQNYLTDQYGNIITDQFGNPIQLGATPAWTLGSSGVLSMGNPVGLAQSTAQAFFLGSGSTVVNGFSGTPYVLTPILAGSVGQWSGSSWTSTTLGIGHVPACCAYDAQGNLQVATIQNTLWAIGPNGAILSSGVVPQYAGQNQTVPLGPSAILASGGGLYVETSMPGVLIQVV